MSKIEKYSRSIAKKLKAIAATGEIGRAPEVFDAFVQSMFNGIANPLLMNSAILGRFVAVKPGWRMPVKRYKADSAAWHMMSEAARDYEKAVAACPPFSDILGAICCEFGDRSLGQFLSPTDLADLVAGILGAMQARRGDGERTSICDETGCGAGGLILAHLRRIYELDGAEGIARLDVFVNDLDSAMVKACCVQIAMPIYAKQMKLNSFKASCCNVLPNANPSDFNLVYEHTSTKGVSDIGALIDMIRMMGIAEATR